MWQVGWELLVVASPLSQPVERKREALKKQTQRHVLWVEVSLQRDFRQKWVFVFCFFRFCYLFSVLFFADVDLFVFGGIS